MVGIVMTVVAGHRVYCTLDHGTLPTMAKNYFVILLKNSITVRLLKPGPPRQ